MNASTPRILVIGYGNPGRRDDGLGPALAEAVERMDLPGVTVEADYQLTVEDAATAAGFEIVIFADATVEGDGSFAFRRVQPCDGSEANGPCFTSHHLEPAQVLELTRRAFRQEPQGYLLAIRGYDFDGFGEELSVRAKANLAKAAAFLEAAVRLKLVLTEPAERDLRIA